MSNDRLAELEQWIEEKKSQMGESKFNRNAPRYPEFQEYLGLKVQLNNTQQQAQKSNWKSDAATNSQKAYLVKLGVKLESGMTKGRASQLIDAAKRGELGSVGGWRTDGSN